MCQDALALESWGFARGSALVWQSLAMAGLFPAVAAEALSKAEQEQLRRLLSGKTHEAEAAEGHSYAIRTYGHTSDIHKYIHVHLYRRKT